LVFQNRGVVLGDGGCWETMGLAGVGERLAVHVLVEGGEAHEVVRLRSRAFGVEPVQGLVQDPLHVREGRLAGE
jgi:hypothetical protein